MPSTKAIISLVIFGGLGVTAITASSFLPEDQLSISGTVGAVSSSGFVRPNRLQDAGLLTNADGDFQSAAALSGADALRREASSRLGSGHLLDTEYVWEPVEWPHIEELTDADVATSYDAVDLDGDSPRRPQGHWYRHTISDGESLGALWSNAWGLRASTLYGILADPENARVLNLVHPGQQVEWQLDAEGELRRLRLWSNIAIGHEWVRGNEGGFTRGEVRNIRETSHIVLSGEVRGSIAASLAARDELSTEAADALSVLLDRHLPVRQEARSGDSFSLLIEQEMLVGDDAPYEIRLLAFEYRGAEMTVSAVRNSDGLFYTLDGQSLLPPFDREPFVGNYEVSSAFNLRRRHPVTGRVAPHYGTDFSMPVGTPILAPADGKVTQVSQHLYAGRYIEIEHGQGYTTRYLHLQRALVSEGQSVRRGERIALSGNTGRTTGPHLHYELLVDGRAVDVLVADLPQNESLAGKDLERFQRVAAPMLAELRNAAPSRQVAMRPFSELGL